MMNELGGIHFYKPEEITELRKQKQQAHYFIKPEKNKYGFYVLGREMTKDELLKIKDKDLVHRPPSLMRHSATSK